MNKPIGYDDRYCVDENEIINRYDEGASIEALSSLVVQRNGLKKKEAEYMVDLTLLKHYREKMRGN